jgi:hypothetical protein
MATDYGRREWERLVERLNTRASAVAESEDRIRVTLTNDDGSRRHVTIHMTADQWSHMFGTMWGSFEDGVREVERSLQELPPDHGHLVFGQYELHPSMDETLPENPDDAQMREYLRKHPEGGGNWYALDREGNHIPFPEGPPGDA